MRQNGGSFLNRFREYAPPNCALLQVARDLACRLFMPINSPLAGVPSSFTALLNARKFRNAVCYQYEPAAHTARAEQQRARPFVTPSWSGSTSSEQRFATVRKDAPSGFRPLSVVRWPRQIVG
jgi:hypothetical protein